MTPDESVLEVNDLKMDNRDIRQGSMSNSVNNREVLLRSRIPVSSGSSWSRTMSGRWRDFASSSGTTESGRTSARQRSLSPNPAEQASGFKQKQKTGSGTSVIRWIKTMSGRWDSPRKTHHRRCSSGNPLYQTALSNVDEMDLDLSALHEESERVEAAARVNASVRQGDGDTPLRRSGYRNTRRDDEESLVEVMFHDITDSEAESDDEDLISESHISDFGSETLLEIATESHSDLTSNTRNRESSSSDNGELTDVNNNESSESDNDEPVNLNDNESSADATTRSFGEGDNSTPICSAERRSSIATPQQSSISGSQEEPSSIQSTNEILSTKIAQSHRLSCANESVDSQPNHSLNLGAEEQPVGWNEIPVDNESSSSSRRSSSMTSTTENERESCETYSLESGSDLSNISSEVAPVPVEMKGDGVQEHNTLSAYSHFLSSESSSQSLNSPKSVVKWEKIPVMAVAPVEHKVTVDNVWDMVLGDASDDEDSFDDPLPPTALMTHVEQEVEGNVAIAKDLVSIAKQFETNGMWEQVGELCAAAVKSNLALRGPSADVLADALDGMAGASMALGDVVQAQVYFARSLHVRPVGAGGGKQLEAVSALCGLATAHSEQGQSEEAEERYLEAIQLCKSVRPFIAASESVEVRSKPLVCLGDCYNHFALFLVDCDRYKEAQSIYKLALQSLRSYTEQVANITKLETNGFSKLAEVLHNMGDLFSDRGMYQRAFDSYDESLQIKRDLHGADHVSIAATLNNYSIALQECGRTIDAIERSEQALGMKMRILGPDHLEVAISENSWVDIQCAGKSQGLSSPLLASDNKSVLKRAKHALRVCLAHAGHGSLEVAFAQTACGQALALNESYDKAHKILTRSLNTHQSVKAAWGQSAIASVKHCLGMVCAKQGDIRGAKRNFEEALRIRDDRFGTDSFLAKTTREALLQLRS